MEFTVNDSKRWEIFKNSSGEFDFSMARPTLEKICLEYIMAEKSGRKLRQKDNLENHLSVWVNCLEQCNKFNFPNMELRFKQTVLMSCNAKPDSMLQLAKAFFALSKYSGNLIVQPWRTEYQQIKSFSAMYQETVADVLKGQVPWFMTHMGYHYDMVGFSWKLMPNRPIFDISHYNKITLDFYIAAMECQVLSKVWASLNVRIPITLQHVLAYREAHAGNSREAAEGLLYEMRLQRYNQNTPRAQPPAGQYYQVPPYQYATTPPTQYSPGMMPPTYANPMPHLMDNANHSYQPFGAVPMPVPVYTNPAQLQHNLEVMSINSGPHMAAANPPYSQVMPRAALLPGGSVSSTRQRPLPHTFTPLNMGATNAATEVTHAAAIKPHDLSNFSWDFVYEDLERQGYSKDLGSRGNVLQNAVPPFETHKPNTAREIHTLPSEPKVPKEKPQTYMPAVKDVHKGATKKTNSILVADLEQPSPTTVKIGWECHACTYCNSSGKICSMCGKSREPEREQASSTTTTSGVECPRCTLINAATASFCRICAAMLPNTSAASQH